MRPKLLVLLVALLNLVAGASLGFVAGRASLAPDGDVHAIPAAELESLADGLGLPPERAARVRAILASCGPRFDQVMAGTRPRLRALHEQILAELSAELSPDELSRLTAEYHRRHGAVAPHRVR